MRRFIAGAVCPECRAIDRIVVEMVAGVRQRRCVACGHAEAQAQSLTPEPATRFTTRASEATPIQRVRLIDASTLQREKSTENPSE
jgi:uncharacterized protein